MALTVRHIAAGHGLKALALPTVPRPGLRGVAIASAALFVVILLDALINPRAFFDLWLMRQVQGVDGPGLREGLRAVNHLTGSTGAILAWAAALLGFSVARRWLPAFGLLLIPAGGVVNEVISRVLVARTRPHLAELERSSQNFEERSFPSGHVIGAVMLYGFLFALAAGIPHRGLRLAAQSASVGVIGSVGFARIWTGAHWPTDVLGAYALGAVLVAGLVATYRRIDAVAGGLPLVRAAALPHDEAAEHAHALTSLVVFDRAAGTVTKVYVPGFVPRAIYWLAFQAPFAYDGNPEALRAATHRRNLARLLTRAWYGEDRVAAALGVAPVAAADGRLGLVSELVDGGEPRDRASARAFLRDLRDRFDEVGLPTWQIDPRQPRAIDNVLEASDGTYRIVDLESGLVAPLASRRAWRRALARDLVPFYDEVYFDVTRAYVDREAAMLAAALGADGLAALRAELDAAEAATAAWHATEPRLWGRLLGGLRIGFDVRSWRGRASARLADGQQRGLAWLDGEIAGWEAEGRIDAAEAAGLRAQLATPGFQAMLPYLGAHVAISVPLRFPFGSVARAMMVLAALGVETGRFLTGRSDRAALRLAWGLHSPLVLLLSAVPGFGSFAYLAARPVQADRLLIRLIADASLKKVPWDLYGRTGTRRFVARPAGAAVSGAESAAVTETVAVTEAAAIAGPTVVETAPAIHVGDVVVAAQAREVTTANASGAASAAVAASPGDHPSWPVPAVVGPLMPRTRWPLAMTVSGVGAPVALAAGRLRGGDGVARAGDALTRAVDRATRVVPALADGAGAALPSGFSALVGVPADRPIWVALRSRGTVGAASAVGASGHRASTRQDSKRSRPDPAVGQLGAGRLPAPGGREGDDGSGDGRSNGVPPSGAEAARGVGPPGEPPGEPRSPPPRDGWRRPP